MNEHEQVLGIMRAKNQRLDQLEPKRTALLVVDMQRCFTQPGCPFTEVFNTLSPGVSTGYVQRVQDMVIPNIQKLLACSREIGSLVVYTAVGTETGDGRDLPCWLRTLDELGLATIGRRIWPPVTDPGWEVDEALAPQSGELVLNKLSAGTFTTTDLEQRLRHQGIESVVVTGVTSDVCVTTTAREAADRGFRTIMVSDGCTTLSAQMHQASLETFNIAPGWVRTTQEVITLLQELRRAA